MSSVQLGGTGGCDWIRSLNPNMHRHDHIQQLWHLMHFFPLLVRAVSSPTGSSCPDQPVTTLLCHPPCNPLPKLRGLAACCRPWPCQPDVRAVGLCIFLKVKLSYFCSRVVFYLPFTESPAAEYILYIAVVLALSQRALSESVTTDVNLVIQGWEHHVSWGTWWNSNFKI